MEDPYEVLDVPRGADDGDIRQAYLRAVRRHPPEGDAAAFSRVRRAYEVLSDPSRRAVLDWGPLLEELVAEANARAHAGRRAEAVARLKRCLVMCPDWVPARVGLASVFLDWGRFREAMREADRLARRPRVEGEWLVLAARARRLWAELPGSPPRRVRRMVEEARALLDRARTLGEEPDLEQARLHLLEGDPERALAVLPQDDTEASVLRLQIHLDRCDDLAFDEEVARLEVDDDVALGLALLARERAAKGDFRALARLVQAAEDLAPSSEAVEALLEMPNELLRLLEERQKVPTSHLRLRRLVGLEIDYLRLPKGRDAAVLEHWKTLLDELRTYPRARRRAWVRDLRAHCPTFCDRNSDTLDLLEAP